MAPSQTRRVLRYIGNRETPEPELYDPVERAIHGNPETRMAAALSLGDLATFAKDVPNPLFSDMTRREGDILFVPSRPDDSAGLFGRLFGLQSWLSLSVGDIDDIAAELKPDKIAEPMEVNLTEALVGWRAWEFWDEDGFLHSLNDDQVWPYLVPMTAECIKDSCVESPRSECSCGIYAVNERGAVPSNDAGCTVYGLVYGWGRYVRGSNGWRAQYAYPKSFLLEPEQADVIEKLREYRVPIYVKQPTRMYDPAEDGYGNGTDEENWNFGAGAQSHAGEDAGEEDEE